MANLVNCWPSPWTAPHTNKAAKSGREDWMPLSAIPPPWLPIRTYARGCKAEWLEIEPLEPAPVRDATTGTFLDQLEQGWISQWGPVGKMP